MPTSYATRSFTSRGIDAEPPKDAVKLATQLIEAELGRFEPKAMPNQYVEALRDYLTAKVERLR